MVHSGSARRSINRDSMSPAGYLDLVVGNNDGELKYYENTGTATAPKFEEKTGSANPFNDIDAIQVSDDVDPRLKPALGDIDGDGTHQQRLDRQPPTSLSQANWT